jgi:hypothetical protein
MNAKHPSHCQQGSIALESALGLSVLVPLIVLGMGYAINTLLLQEDQRELSTQLRAKAQQVKKADQESINTEIHEASDYRYGIAKRSGAQAIWLKDE